MARTPTDYDNRHLVALYDLLQFVSPTLEVLRLCFVAKCTRAFEDQFPRLPKLRELSVHFMELSFVGPGPRYLPDDDSDDGDNSDFDDYEEEMGSTFPLLNKFDVFGVLHFSPFRYWDTLESAAPLLEGLTVPKSQVSHLCRVNEHFGFVVGDESESEKDALREVKTSAWLNNTRPDRRFMAIGLHDEACGVCANPDR
ncbi:hypothetical protein D9611_010585 [Ephemerocybe angulata]|uniref:Uncharacterized protein n=1 Tax=Ephemerocybe angulata TaxID=980116 RepID=A0A8H5FAU1_9AGAR|nr:hypothetical protein D9611_010585 [Tulosesus angulatus]